MAENDPSHAGLNHGRMLKLHSAEAQQSAHRLMADCMSIRPVELIADAIDSFFDEIFIFGYHARRLTELTGIGKGDEIKKENYFDHSGVADATTYSYEAILNYLMHCRSITIGLSDWSGTKVWANSKADKIIAFVRVETDWRAKETFYVFPLVSHFLHYVLPQIKPPRELKTTNH